MNDASSRCDDSVLPRVAVLMAVHAGANAEHFSQALNSVRSQAGTNVRVFLCCDGPLTPHHERVIETIMGKQDVVLRSAQSMGLPASLNHSIDAALADPSIQFFARMDADDISMPERFEQQIEYLSTCPEISIVGTWCIEFTQPGVPLFLKRLPINAAGARLMMVYRSPLAHPTVMVRRGVFEAGFRYNPAETEVEDYELWSRLLHAGYEISNVPQYLFWYRMGDNFYHRRGGLRRAAAEVRTRVRYAYAAGLLRPWHLFAFGGLFLLRLAPRSVKKFAYKMRG